MSKALAGIVSVGFNYSIFDWITYLSLSDALSSCQDRAVVVKSI